MIEEVFADPSLLRHSDYRRRVRDYLDDPTVSSLLFERIAGATPTASIRYSVNCRGASTSTGTSVGEKLMRQRKPDYFDQPRWPRIVPLSDKLAAYAARA